MTSLRFLASFLQRVEVDAFRWHATPCAEAPNEPADLSLLRITILQKEKDSP